MKVKILGMEYEIIMDAEEKDYPKLKGLSGYTDFSIKKIVIRKFEKDEASLENLEYYQQEVLRHEIIHAFFYESGLDGNSDFARNEELIDWIAIQFGKMLNVFIKVGAIEIVFPINDRLSNCPINDPINPPKVKEAKAMAKSNADIVNVISNAINSHNKEMLAKGGIVNLSSMKLGIDYGDGLSKSSTFGGGG